MKLVWGSDNGATELIVEVIQNKYSDLFSESFNVKDIAGEPEIWNSSEVFMIGLPTWYDGDLQSDWEDYFEEFQTIDFTGKKVCLFGLGDQEGYDEYFCDGIGILAEVIIENGGSIFGETERDESYDIDDDCKSLKDQETFYGLCLDEDNQEELTEERIEDWISSLRKFV